MKPMPIIRAREIQEWIATINKIYHNLQEISTLTNQAYASLEDQECVINSNNMVYYDLRQVESMLHDLSRDLSVKIGYATRMLENFED